MIKYAGMMMFCWILLTTTRISGQLHEQYIGCFVDNINDRQLEPVLKYQSNLTIEICIRKCYTETNGTQSEMTYAALANGRRCICRNNSGQQLRDRNCNVQCSGNARQVCGGNSASKFYSMYTVCRVGYFGPYCDRLCHCKGQLPCDRKTGICSDGCEEHWNGTNCNISNDVQKQYIGCYGDRSTKHSMDAKNPGERTGAKNNKTNSNEFCIEICSYNNYTYAGMQYGYDCNCGEAYDKYGTTNNFGRTVDCNMNCPRTGKESQRCGGSFANSVYYVCPKGFYGRDCINRCHCSDGGPCRFNGSCLNSTLNSCKPGWTGSACNVRDCSAANGDCKSDRKCEAVGLGFANLSVCRCEDGYYRYNNICRSIQLHYVGCYNGNTTQYASVDLPTKDTLTIELCILNCRQRNKKYSLIQGGTTCLCGDEYGQISPDDECQVPCVGNKLQYCGGRNTVDGTPIYVVYTAKSFLREYIGCYEDKRVQPALQVKFSWSGAGNNTIDSCIRQCVFHNFMYAGLQYHYDCFCGDSYDKHGPLPESRCNLECTGNRSQICGGNYANSVYAVNDIFGCSTDIDCKQNEACNIINLKYTNVSRCRCIKGFHRMSKWELCTDVDECQMGTSTCNRTSENCLNNVGSFRCECKAGFFNNYGKCEDIDECSNDSHPCQNETELCENTIGSYTCHCKLGYTNSTLGNCTDVDECLPGRPSSQCDEKSEYCVNSVGSYHCECNDGFTKVSDKCEDTDECKNSSVQCDAETELCENRVGTYACKCRQGYERSTTNGKCGSSNIHAVVMSLVILLSVIAILVFVFFWLRRKRIFVKTNNNKSKPVEGQSNHTEEKANDRNQEMSLYINWNKQASSKIPIGELPAMYSSKEAHPRTLEEEFKSVPVDDSSKTCREGKKKELKHRNRFQNIIPYDQNRVILHQHHDKFSDYINASFINSYNNEEKIIATQGPNDDTLTHFWQMIYENNVGTIVMITNLVENAKKKCARYWPEYDGSMTFGDMTITLKLTESWPNYVIRHLQLAKGSDMMNIKQWHFTVWPDHGVPSDVKGFLNFRRNVRQSMSLDKYTIVHCSAGVGRTGTFIAINYLLEQAEAEGVVDVLGCLSFLRQQRPHMVQTLDQYEFIYAALSTEFTVGKTAITAEDFNSTYQNLLVREKLSSKTKLEIQFKVLQEQCVHQIESENPFHVFPKSLEMCEISEAAQAVFVQSWKTKDAFIVPEYPDKATVNYFWTICLDFESKFIVYLDNGQNSPLFFPKQPAEWLSVESWSLQCLSSKSEPYGTRLKVALTHSSESEYENAAVSSTRGELTLLNVKGYLNDTRLNYDAIHATYSAIKSLESKNVANRSANPVVIVSRPNCALSGLFIAAFNAFDMLDEAKEVDLYQVVYDITKSRSKLIPSLATYEELHNIVNHRIEYTSSASVYSNV